jgi:hypothetical protein
MAWRRLLSAWSQGSRLRTFGDYSAISFAGAGRSLPFEDFPWFRDAPVGKVLNVQELCPGHFYWPDLDTDLPAEIVADPGKYPLLAQQ